MILTVSSFSGGGKSTIIRELTNRGLVTEVLSYTDRSSRGKDDRRIFVSADEFLKMQRNGQFCQVVYYDCHHYGLSTSMIKGALNKCKIPVLDVGEDGLKQILAANLGPVISVFLIATPLELKQRLMNQSDPDPHIVRRRLELALHEAQSISCPFWDLIIHNDNLKTTVDKIEKLLQGQSVESDVFDLSSFQKEMKSILATFNEEEEH